MWYYMMNHSNSTYAIWRITLTALRWHYDTWGISYEVWWYMVDQSNITCVKRLKRKKEKKKSWQMTSKSWYRISSTTKWKYWQWQLSNVVYVWVVCVCACVCFKLTRPWINWKTPTSCFVSFSFLSAVILVLLHEVPFKFYTWNNQCTQYLIPAPHTLEQNYCAVGQLICMHEHITHHAGHMNTHTSTHLKPHVPELHTLDMSTNLMHSISHALAHHIIIYWNMHLNTPVTVTKLDFNIL